MVLGKRIFMTNPLKYLYVIILLLSSCANDQTAVEEKLPNNYTTEREKLPFVGKRNFETRKGVSGTGTPQRLVEIKENGEVEFSFLQVNQADKAEIKGFYRAGPFKKIMKCVFKEWYTETSFYEITADKIYETDSSGNRLRSDECCGFLDTAGACACESEYYEPFDI